MKTSYRFNGVQPLNARFSFAARVVALLLAALVPQALLQAQSNYATPYEITTLAGIAGAGHSDGVGGNAQFFNPFSVVVDHLGNCYVADCGNHTIRKLAPDGTVTTFAGVAGVSGSTNGIGNAARFFYPRGLAIDGSDNIYVADYANHTIRKITAAGVVTTLAGTAGVAGSLDGTGGAAKFLSPFGVAVDSAGNVYVADTGNHTIRMVTSAGVVTTLAGMAGSSGSNDGTGNEARFFYPRGVAATPAGVVYVTDYLNHTVRKIASGGVVTTLTGTAGVAGSTNGAASTALMVTPLGIAVDGSGDVFVTNYLGHTIRMITAGGMVSTLAGADGSSGTTDATGTAARFNYPTGLAVDALGNVFVADNISHAIRKVTSAGVVTTLAGAITSAGSADGKGIAARFHQPSGMAIDGAGNLYFADTQNHTIRKMAPDGTVTTFAGTAGKYGATDGTGTAATFYLPTRTAVDGSGNIYVTEAGNHVVRKITPGGVVATIAGSAGTTGSTDGIGSEAQFSGLTGIAVDISGNVFVADNQNQVIRKITSAGVVTTFAGSVGVYGATDGTGSAASFFTPTAIAVDATGNLFVTDRSAIRKITPASVVTTLVGTDGATGYLDGTGSAARFEYPGSIAVDQTGNLFITDNNTIRKITPAGVVTTLAGKKDGFGAVDGRGSAARFFGPGGLAVDGAGTLYIADHINNLIRKGIASSQPDPGQSGAVINFASNIKVAASITLGDLNSTYEGSSSQVMARTVTSVRDAGISAVIKSEAAALAQVGPVYTGSAYSATVTTVPAALPVNITYNGSTTLPTAAGSYEVVGIVNDANFQGYAIGTLVISKATPMITWATPANITYGTALSGVQLNASADVAGTFTYSPSIGSVLNAGAQTLTLTFTPVDTTNYSSVSAQRSITVEGVPAGFDVSDYYARNPSVAAAYGADHYAAWLYYRNQGIYDGEVFDDLFRVEEYLTLYPELFAIFGDDFGAALDHWLSTGRIEGKLGRIPSEFSAAGYFARNTDVATAVNNDPLLAWGHYWLYGIYEGRAYDDELRVFEYLAINADLTAAFVNDWRQAALHWMRYGRTEGRLGRLPLTFSVAEYLNRSPDVAAVWGTNPTTVFLHFWLYGIDENRTYDDLFRPDQYLVLNPDLHAALGTDRRLAFKHWVRYGMTEGRPGKNP